MAGEPERIQIASTHAAILVELEQQRQSVLGQEECRRDQCHHRVSLVEVETEGVAPGPDEWQCGSRQADCRNRRMFRLPRDWSNPGCGQPDSDPAQARI